MRDSQLYRRWYKQVCVSPPNDFLIVISPSSKTPVSGTGKTTQATGLAKKLDMSESGFDAEEKATLSAKEFAYEIIPNVEDRSAVLLDEAQGTPGGGSGLNRMRAMKQETLDAIGSVLANRDKMLTIIVIVQQFNMLFSDLYPMIDAWLLIREGPGQPKGPLATHHMVHTEDYELKSPRIKTPAIEDVSWKPLPHDDPDYQVMERKKQAAKQKGGDDENGSDGLSDREQLLLAEGYRRQGVAWRKIPNQDDRLTYSHEWYRQRIDDDAVVDGGAKTA